MKSRPSTNSPKPLPSSVTGSFLAPNIESIGRRVRGAGGGLLGVGAAILASEHPMLAAIMAASGGFLIFEAARGWCVLRACKIKTPF